jgi:Holliday junction resolvase
MEASMATSRTGRSDVLPKARTEENERAMKLVAEMLAGDMVDIRPQLDFTSEVGFTYPIAEQILKAKGEAVLSVLEFLADKGILNRNFFDRLFRCPSCQSMNLRPSTHCPKCGSANIVRGRVLEHLICKHVGIEDDFLTGGRYVCPKCKVELRTIGMDYQSLGLLRKCHDCEDIFNAPVLKWRCLKCSSLSAEDRVKEVNIYSYSFNEARRSRLEFEIRPKSQLVEFLKRRGYEIVENATMKGRSGAEHKLDMLATRDDGIVTHNIAIGVEVAGEKIGLERIFSFDDKTYDIGIHDKILIVIPNLEREAETFASQQRIQVLEVKDLETVLATGILQPGEVTEKEPFEFKSKSQLVEFLKQRGYEVVENATMKGRSGAEHNIDILATRDDGIVIHHIAIGVEVGQDKIGLDKVFDFDDKTYDIGIRDKVFIAVPGLTREARQFAERQRIKVFEAKEL